MTLKEPIRCCDGCGASVADEAEANAKAWTRLQITGRLRCPACAQALDTINQRTRNDDPSIDLSRPR